MKEYHKEWYQKNKKFLQEKSRKYHQEHKEEIKNRKKAYYENNKDLIRVRNHSYRQKNKEKIQAYNKRYRQENAKFRQESKLKYKYGITVDQKYAMALIQDWKCAICNAEKYPDSLVVDHDHDKLKGEGVRKLLCDPCNKGLGFFKDSSILLYEAAKYLEEFGK